MRAVTRSLGVARSNVCKRLTAAASDPSPRQRVRKADDAWLLPMVQAVTDQRPT
jgi:hypothetical protein